MDTHDLGIIGDLVTAFFDKPKVELVTYVAMQAIAELLRFDFNRASIAFASRNYKPVQTCLRASYDNFNDPMVSLFVTKHLKPSITDSFRTMFENIKEGVNQTAGSFDWMDETTRVKARVKVNTATLQIVETTIREVNAEEEYMTGDFLANYVRIARYNKERANRYPQSGKKLEEALNLLVGGVTVDHQDIVISVPATHLLEPVLFENVREKFVNMSVVGSVLASEIVSVAFAPSGSMYAAGGLKMRWWPERVYRTYEQRLACYESEYYRLEKDFVTSSNSSTGTRLPEDVREFLMTYTRGLEISYALADIKYNNNAQLFFMRYCQQFCDSNAGNPTQQRANLNVRLACMFPLVHNEGFRETFGCEHTHTLYPKVNCARL
ncbi:hypothetical protein V5799_030141 [Amblyomma americanum]|uniref:M13 family peptidase n=1 Tax=Amblyomma americanum TaxID=6943 RepID=A0AAQ4EP14_AMBAM